jgi:hypothetical protein
MTRPPPPTDEQLRLAFRQISRPSWPSTLEAALENPLYRTCLIGMARNLNRRGIDRRPPPTAPAPLPLFEGLDHEPQSTDDSHPAG